jgi:multisubunit Na+/H+ antiporter MnhB subunit
VASSRQRQRRAAPRGAGEPRPGAVRQPLVTPSSVDPVRHKVERRSAVWLLYLSRLPRVVVAVVAAAVFLVGVLAPGPAGGFALLVLAVALSLLAYVTWHAVRDSGQWLRLLAIAVLAAWGIAKILA